MKKSEAVEYIQQELARGRSADEITTTLSQQLGAPSEVVAAFVSNVAQAFKTQPSPVAPSSVPPPNQFPPADMFASDKIPQGMENAAGAAGQEALEKMVLDALKKNRRHSDIVMMVCEQTGSSWDQAQRLVGRVASQNRKSLITRQNTLIIPLTLVAILAGLALVTAGVDEGLKAAASAADGLGYEDISQIEYIIRYGIWGFVLGFTLLIGGIYGLIRALQAQTG